MGEEIIACFGQRKRLAEMKKENKTEACAFVLIAWVGWLKL